MPGSYHDNTNTQDSITREERMEEVSRGACICLGWRAQERRLGSGWARTSTSRAFAKARSRRSIRRVRHANLSPSTMLRYLETTRKQQGNNRRMLHSHEIRLFMIQTPHSRAAGRPLCVCLHSRFPVWKSPDDRWWRRLLGHLLLCCLFLFLFWLRGRGWR